MLVEEINLFECGECLGAQHVYMKSLETNAHVSLKMKTCVRDVILSLEVGSRIV